MAESMNRRALITKDDILCSARIAEARFDDPELETMRTLAARELLGCAFALEQALRAQNRCTLVNHCGTRGSNNLAQATENLFDALYAYAGAIRGMAARFRDEDMLPAEQQETVQLRAV